MWIYDFIFLLMKDNIEIRNHMKSDETNLRDCWKHAATARIWGSKSSPILRQKQWLQRKVLNQNIQ